MLRRREKAGKTVHTVRENAKTDRAGNVKTDRSGNVRDFLEPLVGNARVESDQISMSASRVGISQDRAADHARGAREELLRQMDQAEKAQQKITELEREIGRMREAYEQEVLCRKAQQERVLQLMEHSKHYTSLMKALQRPAVSGGQEKNAQEERRETLKRLVQLLKENNIMLGNMAKELARQQRQWEQANPFFRKEEPKGVSRWIEENVSSSRANLARQEAILGEMETVEQCLAQQKDSVGKLEQVLDEMKELAQQSAE